MTDRSERSSMGDGSLGALLRQARGGNGAARNRLFEDCRNYLHVVARAQVESWLQRKVDASDVVQQTLLEAHRGFGDFQGETEAEWLGWLRRILIRNATDFVRQYGMTEKRKVSREVPLGRRQDSSAGRGVPEPSAAVETPSRILMHFEQGLQVADAIARLSPDHQEVVMLRSLQRLPFEEVARRMGRSRPAAQMLWARAIRNLQELLEP